jgi:hypothetical protein
MALSEALKALSTAWVSLHMQSNGEYCQWIPVFINVFSNLQMFLQSVHAVES